MESFKILNEKENPLFNRKEIQVSVESQTNPKKQEIKDLLSEKLSVPKENIKIKKIFGNFGSKTFNINANIYSSKKDKEFLEKENEGKVKEKHEAQEKTLESQSKVPAEEKPLKSEEIREKKEEQELGEPEKEPHTTKQESKEK